MTEENKKSGCKVKVITTGVLAAALGFFAADGITNDASIIRKIFNRSQKEITLHKTHPEHVTIYNPNTNEVITVGKSTNDTLVEYNVNDLHARSSNGHNIYFGQDPEGPQIVVETDTVDLSDGQRKNLEDRLRTAQGKLNTANAALKRANAQNKKYAETLPKIKGEAARARQVIKYMKGKGTFMDADAATIIAKGLGKGPIGMYILPESKGLKMSEDDYTELGTCMLFGRAFSRELINAGKDYVRVTPVEVTKLDPNGKPFTYTATLKQVLEEVNANRTPYWFTIHQNFK